MKASILFSLLLPVCIFAQNAPEKSAPFTAVKWEGNLPEVQIDEEWYGLSGIDGLTIQDFESFGIKTYGPSKWKKRFSEDLVEFMTAIGKAPKSTVALVLLKNGKTINRSAAMTEANRRAVWNYNRSQSESGSPAMAQRFSSQGNTQKARNAAEMLAAGYKRYNVESGIVELAVEGSQQGTEKIYFDSWGWREATYESTTLKVMGMEHKNERVMYIDGEWMISYDPKTNYATRTTNPMLTDLMEKGETQNLTEVGQQMIENAGAKMTGTETIAGKECQKWELSSLGTTTWVWKGLTLKIVTNIMGMTITKMATSVQTGVSVPTDKLIPPAEAKGMSSPMPEKE